MRVEKIIRIGLVGVLLFLTGACRNEDWRRTKVQYMPDMADTPVVVPQRSYIDPPAYSVAINAVIYPEDWAVAEREFRSIYRPGFGNYGEVLKEGGRLFNVYCAVCHGNDGRGEGYLGDSYPIPVPSLVREDVAQRADGYYFMTISKGRGLMPSYGHAISPMERWQIVAHIRELQNNDEQ